MAIIRLATETRNALASTLGNLIDAGGGPATISFYDGVQPANVSVSIADQVLLGVLRCSFPAAGAAQGGVLTFNEINEENSAPATGKAKWARVADSHGNPAFDCDVTGPAGGGTIEINTVDIVKGGPVRMRGFIITFPAG